MARKFTFPKGKNCDLPFDLQISQFIFELEVADNFYFGIETLLESHNMMHSGNVLSAFLLAMKKYGLNNDKLMEFMYNFAHQIAKVKAGVNELNDGASIAWGNLYPKYSDRSKKENKIWKNSAMGTSSLIIGNLLYCIDAFMEDRLLKINKQDSRKGIVIKDEEAKVYYYDYLKTDKN